MKVSSFKLAAIVPKKGSDCFFVDLIEEVAEEILEDYKESSLPKNFNWSSNKRLLRKQLQKRKRVWRICLLQWLITFYFQNNHCHPFQAELWKREEKQTTLHRFLVREGSNQSHVVLSVKKRHWREISIEKRLAWSLYRDSITLPKNNTSPPYPSSPYYIRQKDSSIKLKWRQMFLYFIYLSFLFLSYLLFSSIKTRVVLYKMSLFMIFLDMCKWLIEFTLFLRRILPSFSFIWFFELSGTDSGR